MILNRLYEKNIIHPPKWLLSNTVYLTLVGSQAYGTSLDKSDQDIYGITIPLREDVFPHLRGEIQNFGRQKQRFDQWQEHHIKDPDKDDEYDFTVYSIIQYFRLAMECNPNIVDSLFVPSTCILHSTNIGQRIRENRKIFLHKGIYFKLKGYAFSQLSRITTNKSAASESRRELVEKYGYDTKYAMHLFRLILQCEDVLIHGDLDLQRHREQLKAVRRGHYTVEEIKQWFSNKEKDLEKLYAESTALPYSPNEKEIKQLLIGCLEEHYGSIEKMLYTNEEIKNIINDIEDKLTILRKALT